MSAVVETHGLTKEFPGGRGVREIHLTVKQGQVFGFLGPNGAGKSTFVKMLVGLLTPTSGEARVLGLPAGDLTGRKRIGYMPELFRYQDWLTAEEVLRFHAKLCKMDKQRTDTRIRRVLAEVGLVGRERDRVKHYSKGMQQRLGLACALLAEPEVLFLDEPASALDPGGRHEVRELLRRLAGDGMTVFLNTHLLEDVESICSEVALLIDGRVRESGAVRDILHPEPVWEFTVRGWDSDVSQVLTGVLAQTGVTLESASDVPASEVAETGYARLRARLRHSEQVAWLNEQLVLQGVSVYGIEPHTTKLESWFLTRTEAQGADARDVREWER